MLEVCELMELNSKKDLMDLVFMLPKMLNLFVVLGSVLCIPSKVLSSAQIHGV